MTEGSGLGSTVARLTIERMPDSVKRRLAGPYNRYQETRADLAFGRRSREALSPAADAPDHVVCVVVDALRRDAIDPRDAPYLADRLAGTAITPATWTFPAVTSLVTGQYPHEHGAMRTTDDADRGSTDLVVPPTLPAEAPTLPEIFAAAGYETYGAFAFHMPFFALGGRFGTHALYDDAPAERVLADFAEWFEANEDDGAGRTFSYVHLGDLHEPVEPPWPYPERHEVDDDIDGLARWRYRTEPDPGPDGERYREHRGRLYRAAVDYVDDELAALADRVTGRDDVALLVVGDHGEALWEWTGFDADRFVDSRPAYCVDHGGTPYESLAQVPLVVDGLDGLADLSAKDRLSLVDVAPTLLEQIGHPDAIDTSGHALSSPPPADRVVLTEAARYGYEKKAAYVEDWKLLVSKADDEAVGFELPDEEPATLPARVETRLLDAMPPWPDGEAPEHNVSGLARDRLEALGYV